MVDSTGTCNAITSPLCRKTLPPLSLASTSRLPYTVPTTYMASCSTSASRCAPTKGWPNIGTVPVGAIRSPTLRPNGSRMHLERRTQSWRPSAQRSLYTIKRGLPHHTFRTRSYVERHSG
jgi:hypothetical protein